MGITVLTATGLGALILAFDGPPDTVHADLELRVDPGAAAAWGTGDEKVQVRHLGGEPLRESGMAIRFEAGGTAYEYSGSELGFAGGSLSIGETWESPDGLVLAEDQAVDVHVVSREAGAVVATGTVTGRGAFTSCSRDTSPPSASVAKDPQDISVVTLDQTPTVTAVLSDPVCGVDATKAPVLKWGYSSPPTNTATMALAGGAWSATLPDQGAWSARNGQTLYYQVTGMTDLRAPAGNVGSTAILSDPIGPSYTYVGSRTDRVGSIGSFAGAQAADALAATLTEGAAASATLAGATLSGTMADPARAGASDNQHAVSSSSAAGQLVEASGFDVPAAATGIREVKVLVEAKETANGQDPVLRVDWRIGATGPFVTGTATQPVSGTNDAQYAIDLTDRRDWTVADVEALQLQVVATTTRSVSIDQVALGVVHASPSGTQKAAATVLAFDGVPDTAADSYTFQLRYQSSGDAFTVQSWDPTQNGNNGGWVAEAGTLTTEGAYTVFSSTLSPSEHNAGAPRIRILDAAPAGTTTGSWQIEYARVWAQ